MLRAKSPARSKVPRGSLASRVSTQEAVETPLDDPSFYALPAAFRQTRILGQDFKYVTYDLAKHFKIICDANAPSDQLVITAHGSYAPWSDKIDVPAGVTLKFLNPHGTFLADPGIAKIASGSDKTFASLSNDGIAAATQEAQTFIDAGRYDAVSGSAAQGTVRNYRLAKYREDDAASVVNALSSNRTFARNGMATKSDFLVVRNRRDVQSLFSSVTLRDVFTALAANGIHYKTIVCAFCRNSVTGIGSTFDPTQATPIPPRTAAAMINLSRSLRGAQGDRR